MLHSRAPRIWRAACVLFICAASFAAADDARDDCNGHGTLTDGRCMCDNTFPASGENGWTGDDCEIPVYGVQLNSVGVKEQCSGKPGCGSMGITEKNVCFYSRLDWGSPWNYLLIQMEQSTFGGGDPDLYGYFTSTNERARTPTSDNGSPSFVELSSTAQHIVGLKLDKADYQAAYEAHSYDGVHMCINNLRVGAMLGDDDTKPTVFDLRGEATACPGKYLLNGDLTICSATPDTEGKLGSHSDGCGAGGVCKCRAPYLPPDGVTTYTDAGFDDCSALSVDTAASSDVTPLSTQFHRDYEQPVGSMYVFQIEVPETFSQLKVLAEVEDEKGQEVMVLLKFEAPPGPDYGQYDVRSSFRDADTGMNDRYVSLVQGPDSPFRAGLWWVGVSASHANVTATAVRYDLTIEANLCLDNCSTHGTCETGLDGAAKCKCDEGHFLDNCAGSHKALDWNVPNTEGPLQGTTSYWEMDAAALDHLDSIGDFSIVITVDESTYPEDAEGVEAMLQIGPEGAFPTRESNTLRQQLSLTQDTVLHVCDTQLPKGSGLVVGVVALNPYYDLTYTIKAISTGSCREGSLRPEARPLSHGTCWQPCVCKDGTCSYAEKCTQFTCDQAPQNARVLYRPNPTRPECVIDECRKDRWLETQSHVCLEVCSCPSNGGACTIQKGCHGAYFSCKSKYRRHDDLSKMECVVDHTHEGQETSRKACQRSFPVWAVVLALLAIGGFGLFAARGFDTQSVQAAVQRVWARTRGANEHAYVELRDSTLP